MVAAAVQVLVMDVKGIAFSMTLNGDNINNINSFLTQTKKHNAHKCRTIKAMPSRQLP